MRQTNLKINEHLDIESQIAEFFAKGKTIEQVPSDVYKRESITQRDKCAILQTNAPKKEKAEKRHGEALRATFESTYRQRQIMQGEL